MWFNSTQREEPYLGSNGWCHRWKHRVLAITSRVASRGAAWLSSARAVRCSVKSGNERNPYVLLPAGHAGDSVQTACASRRKVGTTSSHHGPYVQGYTRATMVATKGCQPAKGSKPQKSALSSDWSLQLDSMKLESLVIADQLRRGEYVPGPCTHRPSHHESWHRPKSLRGLRRC